MDEQDWELAKILVAATLFIFLFMGICLGIADVQMSITCQRYAAMNPQYEFRYDWFIMDCFMKTPDGMWVSIGNIYANEKLVVP